MRSSFQKRGRRKCLGHRVVHLRVHRDGDVFFHAQLAEQADVLERTRDASAVDLRGVEVMDVFAV